MNSIRFLKNKKGQAITEYILVLTVVLFVFLILLQFNKQFRKWGEDYFVAYYRCLLETGEVPSLGGQNAAAGICSSQFQAFTFTGGWQPIPGEGSGGGGGGGSGSGAGEGGGSAAGNGAGQKSTGGEGGLERGSEVSKVSGSSGRGATRFKKFRSNKDGGGASGSGGGKNKKKKAYTGSSETTSFGTKSSKRFISRRRKSLNYGYGTYRREEDRGEERSVSSIKKATETAKEKKRIRLRKGKVKKKVETDTEGFTLGGFLRYLLIAAIIIVLGVLIGGQLLQISKGVDAEG